MHFRRFACRVSPSGMYVCMRYVCVLPRAVEKAFGLWGLWVRPSFKRRRRDSCDLWSPNFVCMTHDLHFACMRFMFFSFFTWKERSLGPWTGSLSNMSEKPSYFCGPMNGLYSDNEKEPPDLASPLAIFHPAYPQKLRIDTVCLPPSAHAP